MPRKKIWQIATDPRHKIKYATRRPSHAPICGAIKQPTIAPTPCHVCACALAPAFAAPASLSASNGIHCTDPQVPINAIDASSTPKSARPNKPDSMISRTGFDAVTETDFFQRCDSGTNNKMTNTNTAGSAPTKKNPTPRLDRHRLQNRNNPDQKKSNIRGRSDQSRQHRPPFLRPTFHHQRHAQCPLPTHSQRRQKSARPQVPRNLREISQPGEKRIRQNTCRQRAHASDSIPEPSKNHPAGRRPQQKTRRHLRHPRPHLRVRPARQHAQQRRPRHHWEQPNFKPIE